MKDVIIKLKCFLSGHIWRYENNPTAFLPRRQCNRCGLVHERLVYWSGDTRYVNRGYQGTEQGVKTGLQVWKDKHGIIE